MVEQDIQNELESLIKECLWLSTLTELRLLVSNNHFVPTLNYNNSQHYKLGQYLETREHIKVYWVK